MKTIAIYLIAMLVLLSGCNTGSNIQGINPPSTTSQSTTQSTVSTTQSTIYTTISETSIGDPGNPLGNCLREFTIEGDDNSIYPNQLSMCGGIPVKITFKVRQENVYYGGLQFISDYFDTGKIAPGDSKTIEFTPGAQPFKIVSYWPASSVKKAEASVAIEHG